MQHKVNQDLKALRTDAVLVDDLIAGAKVKSENQRAEAVDLFGRFFADIAGLAITALCDCDHQAAPSIRRSGRPCQRRLPTELECQMLRATLGRSDY